MKPNPDCPACHGRGQWYSPDNGQIVTCDCEVNKPVAEASKSSVTDAKYSTLGATTHRTNLQRRKTNITGSDLKRLEWFVQLHQTIEIVYVVDGYLANYMVTDGQVCERTVKGETILEALQLLEMSLQTNPPKFGGPSWTRKGK